ncbi:YwqG family protein [Actinoplanes sp. NBC_00393]|uniref:DUF1963 domain-containing protein n=1 Tax=Actinoplanes sp. NBC_00393 TaxID=2975953 RepID=UPI002E1C4D6C
MSDLDELLSGWRTLSEWEQDPYRDYRAWNRLVDKCNHLAEKAVADPAGVEALRKIAAEDPDRSVRLNARHFTTPYVPRPDSKRDLDRWMNHPLIDLVSLGIEPRVGFALSPGEEFDIEEELTEIGLCWFGGEPVTDGSGEWPRRPDGTPLIHLLQVELGNQPLLDDNYPLDGVLQFFHDLDGAGEVRLVSGEPTGLLARPDDAPVRQRRRAHVDPVWTFPAAGDLDRELAPAEAGRLDLAHRRLRETLLNEWGLHEHTDPAPEYPLMLGWAGLLSLPEPPIDFKIREDDLRAGALDTAWAVQKSKASNHSPPR